MVPGYTAKTGFPGRNSCVVEGSFLFGNGNIHDIDSLYVLQDYKKKNNQQLSQNDTAKKVFIMSGLINYLWPPPSSSSPGSSSSTSTLSQKFELSF